MPEFKFDEDNHDQVRQRLIDHILLVNSEPRHPLNPKYTFLINEIMLETVDDVVSRLRKAGTVEGWGGMDVSTFMADALGVDVHIFNMDDGNLYDLNVSSEIRGGAKPVLFLFFSHSHYQALVS